MIFFFRDRSSESVKEKSKIQGMFFTSCTVPYNEKETFSITTIFVRTCSVREFVSPNTSEKGERFY